MIILSIILGTFLLLFIFLYFSQIHKTKKLEQKLISEHHSKLFYFQEFNRKLQEEIRQRTLHLETTASELQKSNQDLDTFIYKTSHDIKSPLTSLDGLCEIMLLENDLEVVREYVKKQKHTIATMQLLLFRVVEIGDIRHHKVLVNNIKLLPYFKKAIKGMAKEENYGVIDFQLDINADLKIITDVEMLDLIVINILKNAMENIESLDKNKQPIIRVQIEEKEQAIIIAITDNGKGVPKNISKTLFDMFVKGHQGDKHFGLGLYKAKIVAHKIQGDIQFIKKPKYQGACFMITLPKRLEIES